MYLLRDDVTHKLYFSKKKLKMIQ